MNFDCPRCEGTGIYQRFMGPPKACAICNGTGKMNMSDSTPDVVLIQKLSKKEWLLRNRFEQALAKNKKVHDDNVESAKVNPQVKFGDYPFSEDQMVDLELDMLTAQIELQRAVGPAADGDTTTEAADSPTTPQEYQTLLLAELDKAAANYLFNLLTADQQRQVKAARAAVADADLVVATQMFACYQTINNENAP